ncbi:chemotaxis protein CheA [Vannielia litorea]|uniref:Chemotaxis protein CheA n=1 Tax=Vannielia litorea TaxID=1217970 RepID=A0A1N6F307_9RHOB|nr:chemotaxis protein CheA [Vannielia litorea]SIN89627.1 two-component system, chemotaxis family, sensor kinase CheA [Vannielia litorea]
MSTDPMAEIRASFFIECEELLESLQDGLTAMDDGDTESETINVCFRAVHSIKGGAGAFGLEELVRFAHRFETVMDEIRNGRLEPSRDTIALFFRGADVLYDIVRASRDGDSLDKATTEAVLGDLEALVGGVIEKEEAEEEIDFAPMTLTLDPLEAGEDGDVADLAPQDDSPPGFEIRFQPAAELFASGNEPRHLLAALHDLGEVTTTCDLSRIPSLDGLAPEEGHIGWSCRLVTGARKEEVAEIFEFVEGLCELSIEPTGRAAPGLPDLDSILIPGTVPDDVAAAADEATETAPEPEPLAIAPAPPADPLATAAPVPAPPAAPPAGGKDSKQAASAKATVRVDLDRIERLVNLVGELVINQAMLSQSVAEAGIPANSTVASGLEEFLQLTRDIQESVMMIRAQPVKSLFQRMSRIVRESSAMVGKSVRFVTDGEQTEIDKTVIERLADPLTHMVRNAVDHGLETTERRLAAGKPADGVVTLTAAHKSGRVVLEIKDDGAGIDREVVKAKAEEKGLIAPGVPMSDQEIDNLLFLPGFSTAKQVSDLSGRGVGMDVVRSSIQALGGRVTITSEPGSGTTFSISLPLTLAVLDGMVVEAGGEILVVPLGSISETLTLQAADMEQLGAGTTLVRIREEFVPLLDMAVQLGFRTPLPSYVGSSVLLIAMEDNTRSALVVDRIVEQRQVVIKGLQESYGRIPGIAAATILGNGRIALILDPADLIASASNTRGMQPFDLAG